MKILCSNICYSKLYFLFETCICYNVVILKDIFLYKFAIQHSSKFKDAAIVDGIEFLVAYHIPQFIPLLQ